MAVLLLVTLLLAAGCGSEPGRPVASATPPEPAPIAPPDAGMPAGHDNEPRRVRVR